MQATPYVVKSLNQRNTAMFQPILGKRTLQNVKICGNGVFWTLSGIFHTFHGYAGGYAGIIQGPRGSYPLSQRNTTKLMIPHGPKFRKKSLKLRRNVPRQECKISHLQLPSTTGALWDQIDNFPHTIGYQGVVENCRLTTLFCKIWLCTCKHFFYVCVKY